MRLCLFEVDAGNLHPLSLTRPVFDLLCGRTTIRWKQLKFWAPHECGLLIRPHLAELARLGAPGLPVNDPVWMAAGLTLMVNGRWLPPGGRPNLPAGPCVGLAGGEVAYALVGPSEVERLTLDRLPEALESWQNDLPAHAAGGALIRYPWEIVEHNAAQLERDFALMLGEAPQPSVPARLALVGPADRLWVHAEARIDPYVVVDTTRGSVIIDAHAVIAPFSRLEGPCCVGPSTQVHGANIRGGTTLGVQCRVGGEVEASIMHGYSNKYHEGFLGHSYVGEWVNLGAGTHNSDLRNDYGEVMVTIDGQAVATGQAKVGCFLGDHTKTGLGTLLNTGTSVGAFCNLLPAGRFAPKYVPSFTDWWNGGLREGCALDQLLGTARQVMQRRGQTLTDAHIGLYQRLWQETAPDRRRVIWDSAQRELRRCASRLQPRWDVSNAV
jgi:UDP-N-acetylglucosamine diphosphorylase/glucosamine-1-phosphate N-acetyltransferase